MLAFVECGNTELGADLGGAGDDGDAVVHDARRQERYVISERLKGGIREKGLTVLVFNSLRSGQIT